MKNIDQIVRVTIAFGTLFMVMLNLTTGISAITLLIISTMMFATGMIGSCPIYKILKIAPKN
jgi:hypothetical protein